MSENEIEVNHDRRRTKRRVARRLDAAGWGLFFIWMGASLLLDVGWGIWFVGVGGIILLGQSARPHFGLQLEGFWMVAGTLFLLGGVWQLYSIDVDLLPILLILAGVGLILSIFRHRSRMGWRDWCRDDRSPEGDRNRCCW